MQMSDERLIREERIRTALSASPAEREIEQGA
jgi:hypothetical protein